MKTCVASFEQRPSINIEYLPTGARVSIKDGAIWFDTDGDSAARIEALFLQD